MFLKLTSILSRTGGAPPGQAGAADGEGGPAGPARPLRGRVQGLQHGHGETHQGHGRPKGPLPLKGDLQAFL